ncbi:hypothetical protein C8R46DRAFT_1065474 [Mycena filopes]|nr:hypothetical protein C8R46DRAFT_1065474 [Mycena filopes]
MTKTRPTLSRFRPTLSRLRPTLSRLRRCVPPSYTRLMSMPMAMRLGLRCRLSLRFDLLYPYPLCYLPPSPPYVLPPRPHLCPMPICPMLSILCFPSAHSFLLYFFRATQL